VQHEVFFIENHHPGLTPQQIWDRMFTTVAPEQLMQAFTPEEQAAIQASKVQEGMTKESVLVAVGYPPDSKTPTRDEPTWRYYVSRSKSYFVTFENNVVVSISDHPPGAEPAERPDVAPPPEPEPEPEYYVAHNIWYEAAGDDIDSANYQKGFRIPPGTPVSNLRKKGRSVSFTDTKSGLDHRVKFVRKHHPQKSSEDVWERMFTTKTFEELTQGLNADEIDHIQKGTVGKGISKRAVLISLGYPPESKTPAITVDRWRYYNHRYDSYLVHFEGDRVSKIQTKR
jgi:outer membrane protein assembly factor BamE (lipoprotein component of BamABCDE complex)